MVKKLDSVDVVTVGVGWAGGIVAAEVARAGFKVVGLERGEDRSTEDFAHKHDELRYEKRKEIMIDLKDDTLTFRNDSEQTALPLREASKSTIGTGTGGGGLHWAAQTHRYFPYDFEIRSQTIDRYGSDKIPEDMPIHDWGITYEELEPYYDKFEKVMGTSGERNELEPPRESDFPTPAMPKTRLMERFEEATGNMGFSPYVIPVGMVSENYENPDGQTLNQCQLNGFCVSFACEWGARSSPVTTVVPTAKATGNYELRNNCTVTRVLHEDGKATGVLYKNTLTGEEFEQPADVVVLSSYTFNNVRLLLLSDIGEQYNPQTGEGLIGKNFTDHHNYWGTFGFFEEKFNRYIGTGALGMAFGDYNADNFDHTDYDFIHGTQIEIREEGIMPISDNHVPEGTPRWGREFKKQSLHYANRKIDVRSQHASMPHVDNYLDLDPTYTDKFGDPLIRVTYNFTDNERKLNDFVIDLSKKVLEEMGAISTIPNAPPEDFEPGFVGQHNAGGAIMGESPENSVVNNYQQVWEMDNLFVCGASAFPHFGPTNPTLTLGAITYRTAEGIIEYLEGDGGLLVEELEEVES